MNNEHSLIRNLVCLTGLLMAATLTSACSVQKLDKNGVNSIDLVKTSARVVRKDCAGHVVSDRTEVVGKAEQWVAVDPEPGFEPVSGDFYNRTTRTHSIVSNHTHFLVQYGVRDLGMFVNQGINEVQYKFYSCPDRTSRSCSSQSYVEAESGIVKLDVHYREEFDPSPRTLEASNCDT